MPTAFGPALRSAWMLDPELLYLNHGTVGAPPRAVLAAQQAIRDEIERDPAQFLLRELADTDGLGVPALPRMRAAAARVAGFLGVAADDLAFVDNATTGANAVLRSFPFAAGDEVLVTSLGYGGVTNAARYATAQRDAVLRTVELPGPGAPAAAFVDRIADAIGPRTRIVLIDHITAETALVLPVAEIAAAAHARGARVLVDGAHAPGSLPLDLDALGVDWYTGNLHKWAWTPRSAGILWAAPEVQADLHPTVISWGYGNGLAAEFDLLGTRDPSPFLAAPAALDQFDAYGLDDVLAYNHDLACAAGRRLAARFGVGHDTPDDMLAAMVSVPLPTTLGHTRDDAMRLRAALHDEDRIEIPIYPGPAQLSLRFSAQIYVDLDDVDRLADAVTARC